MAKWHNYARIRSILTSLVIFVMYVEISTAKNLAGLIDVRLRTDIYVCRTHSHTRVVCCIDKGKGQRVTTEICPRVWSFNFYLLIKYGRRLTNTHASVTTVGLFINFNLHMRLLLGSLGIGRGRESVVLCIVVTSSSNIHFKN